MTPTQRLLLDFVKRAKWRWLPPGLFYFVLAMPMSIANDAAAFMVLPLMASIFSLAIFFSIFNNPTLRGIISLPISRRQLGRVIWWTSIVLPGLMTLSLTLLAFSVGRGLITSRRTSSVDFVQRLIELGLASFLAAGFAVAIALLAYEVKKRVSGHARPAIATFALFALLPILLPLTWQAELPSNGILSILIPVLGLFIFTVLYARAEYLTDWLTWRYVAPRNSGRLSADRSTAANDAPGLVSDQSADASFSRRKSGTGWLALINCLAMQVAPMVVVLAIITLILKALIGSKTHIDSNLFYLSGLLIFLIFPWIASLRSFRSLPVSNHRLALVLLLMSLASVCSMWLLLSLSQSLFPATPRIQIRYALLFIPLQSLALPIFLRFGTSTAKAMWALTPIMFSPLLLIVVGIPPIPPIALYFGWTLIVASFLWTVHELHQPLRSYSVTLTRTMFGASTR